MKQFNEILDLHFINIPVYRHKSGHTHTVWMWRHTYIKQRKPQDCKGGCFYGPHMLLLKKFLKVHLYFFLIKPWKLQPLQVSVFSYAFLKITYLINTLIFIRYPPKYFNYILILPCWLIKWERSTVVPLFYWGIT